MARATKVICLGAALLFRCAILESADAKQPMIGRAAPAFVLQSLDGRRVALADFKGKYVVLHFGAGW